MLGKSELFSHPGKGNPFLKSASCTWVVAISRLCLLHFFDHLPKECRLYVLVSNVMTSIRRRKIGYKNSATRCPFDRAGGERSKAIWAIWPLHAFQKGVSLRRGTLSGCKRIVAGLLMVGTPQLH